MSFRHEHHQGPLPPPQVLAQYNSVIKGGAERIMRMAEEEAAHVRSMDARAMQYLRDERRRGQFFGFGAALLGLAAATVCAYLNQPTPASVIGGSTVVGLVAVFVVGRFKDPPQDQPERSAPPESESPR